MIHWPVLQRGLIHDVLIVLFPLLDYGNWRNVYCKDRFGHFGQSLNFWYKITFWKWKPFSKSFFWLLPLTFWTVGRHVNKPLKIWLNCALAQSKDLKFKIRRSWTVTLKDLKNIIHNMFWKKKHLYLKLRMLLKKSFEPIMNCLPPFAMFWMPDQPAASFTTSFFNQVSTIV